MNRAAGKYQESGNYQHPVWNLHEVEQEFGDQVLGMREVILRSECHLLYSDDSLHPSWVGLELLRRVVDQPSTPMITLFQEILDVVTRPVIRYPRDTVLTGTPYGSSD